MRLDASAIVKIITDDVKCGSPRRYGTSPIRSDYHDRMVTGAPASVFISYSHADKDLARVLAAVLQDRGVRIWIDEGELKVGDSIIERIATAIAEIDFFLVLVSESSRSSNWCRKELALAVSGELGREGVKVLPIRINGASMPDALADVYYLDLNAENVDDIADKIVIAIPEHQHERAGYGASRRRASASVGSPPTRSSAPPSDDLPIRIVGIVEEGVGEPRNDRARGSALYRIPLRLSRRPSSVWATYFVETWNHPPQFTSMHRPGIASVTGDTIVLDGTTMDELERYHIDTLRLVLNKVNQDVAAYEAKERAQAERQEQQRRQHADNIREIAGRLKFD